MDNIEGTVIGDNKYIIIPMNNNKDTVELNVEEYAEFYNLFKNINKIEETIDILMRFNENRDNINEDNLHKAIINLISSNEDNINIIFNFLLYISIDQINDLKIKYNDLIIKIGNQFYNSGMNNAKNSYNEENIESKENKTIYNSPKILFDEEETPEFEILSYDEVEEI